MAKQSDLIGGLNTLTNFLHQLQSLTGQSGSKCLQEILDNLHKIFPQVATPSASETANQHKYKNVKLTGGELINLYNNGERDFVGVNLEGALLVGVDLSGINLCDANLSKADCSHSHFSSASFYCADLSGVDFHCTNFALAFVRSACLRKTNLSEANCFLTTFFSSDFLEANLLGTRHLFTANLVSCKNLSAEQLSKAECPSGEEDRKSLEDIIKVYQAFLNLVPAA